MQYTKYGITLIHLMEQEIELVRNWRNDPIVAKNHEFQKYITREEQQKWFRSIQNINNAYFVIRYEGSNVGVINAKNIEWEQHAFESGIFIPDPLAYNTFIPAVISIMMTDLFFRVFLWEKIYAHILKTNLPVIRYNQMLGYTLCDGQKDIDNQLYELTSEMFDQTAGKLLNAMKTVMGQDDDSVILIEPGDERYPVVMHVETQIIQGNPFLKKQTKTDAGRAYYF